VNNLREIQALRRLSPHPNIINLEEVLYDQPSGRLALVFELMDKNLYDLISGRREHLNSNLVASLAYQLFTALEHMHHLGIFHRDVKPENILVDESAKVLKLADFGSCRGTNSKQPFTSYIATRWYRAPECLLSDGYYGSEMDVWAAGSVLFELVSLYPLFPGSDELDQLTRIHKVLGTPLESFVKKLKLKISLKSDFHFPPQKGVGMRHFIPHATSICVNLISQTLIYDYTQRINAKHALSHSYFAKFNDAPELTSEVEQPTKRRIDAGKIKGATYNTGKINPQEALSERARVPKRSVAPSHTKIKTSNLKTTYKKNRPIDDVPKISKHTRRRKFGAGTTKLASLDHRIKEKTNFKRHEAITQQPQRVTKKRNKRFANITSSGYGSTNYKPTVAKARTYTTDDSRMHRGRVESKKPTRLPPIK